MKKSRLNKIVALLLTFGVAQLHAQEVKRIDHGWDFLKSDLGGIWEAVRPVGVGNPESVPLWQQVDLPHCYNALDAVDPAINYYQGPSWYRKSLEIDNPYLNGHTLLHFEGAGQKTAVYIHTVKVGEHVGGYDEWTVDITDAVEKFKKTAAFKKQFKGKIPLSIRVDNSRDLEMIPSNLSDFNVYGGIYRHLNLKYVPQTALERVFVEASVGADGRQGVANVHGRLMPFSAQTNFEVEMQLYDPAGKIVQTQQPQVNKGALNLEFGQFMVKKPQLWSPDQPALYRLVTTIKSNGQVFKEESVFGFRHVAFKEKGPFLLNGKRLLLRGTHRHEDHAGVAAAMTDDQTLQEMTLMKEMGVNFIRLGHYQQSRKVLEACDSLGILVWEEIPWCRGGLGGEVYQLQGKRMLTNMIEQHYNHPSVIIWGLGNENDWPGDFTEFDQAKIRAYMSELNGLAHQLDPSRKTAIRRCDFCKDIVDVYSPSIWAGWYRGVYTDYKAASEEEMKKVKHFLHVEWGGDSHARRHAEDPDRALAKIKGDGTTDERAGDASLIGGAARVSKDGDWSESYICNLIDWHLKEQETMPWLTGTAYWPFKDFSTPVRPDNPVPYVNQKGVVERDFTKKESYYVFQSYWTEKPMLHIYGHSWPVRWGEKDESKMIKVYSNAKEVELFVNGKSQGLKKRNSQDFPAAGLRWMVKLNEGSNQIKAVAKNGREILVDEIEQQYQTKKWGKPAKLLVEKIATEGDMITVQAQIVDNTNTPCLDAKDWIYFGSTGDGQLIVDQGTSTGSKKVQAYNGRALIKLRLPSGSAVVSGRMEGSKSTLLTIEK
ncbi:MULTISPECIES: glycoside hydrolase family 2 TIM barrel-domain containing protein [Sphingobacterium]|uniref:glycoside hydrolase family 2 TIM barrel-domain containing protein n=1 Tax=Sphingobacterium TaxID=28453 RepID=UPI000965585C|nr:MULTISPECIES: glycoside hydrolase family 2 TIM barrel-domain containing protein [Sphingobacterium]OJZ07622.1 MAG: glycoside hydrolase [Sphingobacterium sp. 40-24]